MVKGGEAKDMSKRKDDTTKKGKGHAEAKSKLDGKAQLGSPYRGPLAQHTWIGIGCSHGDTTPPPQVARSMFPVRKQGPPLWTMSIQKQPKPKGGQMSLAGITGEIPEGQEQEHGGRHQASAVPLSQASIGDESRRYDLPGPRATHTCLPVWLMHEERRTVL